MFGSSLPPDFCRRVHVVLCFVCMFTYIDGLHFAVVAYLFSLLCFVFVLFVFVLCRKCLLLRILLIAHSWFPFQVSLTFILLIRIQWVSGCSLAPTQQFSSYILWWEQVNFQWDDNEVDFALDQLAVENSSRSEFTWSSNLNLDLRNTYLNYQRNRGIIYQNLDVQICNSS